MAQVTKFSESISNLIFHIFQVFEISMLKKINNVFLFWPVPHLLKIVQEKNKTRLNHYNSELFKN